MGSESEHTDPEFEARYHFCRLNCPECDRLDQEAIASGMTRFELNMTGLDNVLAALRDGWGGKWGVVPEFDE